MKYTIYKITNQINQKIYIGKHQTLDLHDNYTGSGIQLRRAIAKHGIENFKKEILYVFDNEDDMNDKESELVTEEFCKLDSNYNLCPGGKGGWGYVNSLNDIDIVRIKAGKAAANIHKSKLKTDIEYKKRHLVSFNKLNLEKHATEFRKIHCPNGTFYNRKHSIETKRLIGKINSKLQTGTRNSQFGTMWITDGSSNKKIKKIDTIPEGWYKGRKIRSCSSKERAPGSEPEG